MNSYLKHLIGYLSKNGSRELVNTENRPQVFDFNNTDPIYPICLMIDNSDSTKNNGVIDETNKGLQELSRLLQKDSIASRRVRISGFSFGGTLKAFTPSFVEASDFCPPVLPAGGLTPMGESLVQICDQAKDFKVLCTEAAVESSAIEVIVVTDGEPTDQSSVLSDAKRAMLAAEELGYARFHVFVVDGCDTSLVDAIFPRHAERFSVDNIVPIFRSISSSLRRISRRRVSRRYCLQTEVMQNMRDRNEHLH